VGVKEAKKNFVERREKLIDDTFSPLAEEVRKIKENSIDRIEELIEAAERNFERSGIEFYFTRSSKEAIEVALEFFDGAKTVVKSKSLVAHEIGLVEELEKHGIEIFETDLGDLIVSMLDEKARHFTMPAIHISAERVFRLFDVKDENGLKQRVKEIIRERIFAADGGITGANAVSADGCAIIIENEGNVRLVSSIPERHLIVTGAEKVVETFSDAIKVAELTWRSAGYSMPSYLNVIGGLSKSGDVEKRIITGLHGPEKAGIVVVDNGRTEASKTGLKEALYCLRCGACLFSCPAYIALDAEWGSVYPGGIGQVWNYIAKHETNPFYCLNCGVCEEVCPLSINTPEMIRELKETTLRKIQKF